MAIAPPVESSSPLPPPSARPPADEWMRRILRIGAGPSTVTDDQVHRLFSLSILLSALRCLLSYVVLPVVTPLVGAATNVGPEIGIPVAMVALFFDVKGIRRFWLADHPWRWKMTGVYAVVMVMVTGLLIADVVRLAV